MTYMLDICYDGSAYCGYATQKHKNTIQDNIELQLSLIYKTKIKTYGTSRTDSKVHCKNTYVIFKAPFFIDSNKLLNALNSLLNKDIMIKEIYEIKDEYFPRYDIAYKEYKYVVTKRRDPFNVNYKYFIHYNVSLENMQKASKYLIGENNYKSFCKQKYEDENFIREIYNIDIDESGDDIIFTIKGNGFLYNMVRIIVGTLLEFGKSDMESIMMQEILLKEDRRFAFKTAPAHALYLEKTKLKIQEDINGKKIS